MAKNTNHLQCGCKNIRKITNGQTGSKCKCTTITDKGYKKSKGKILTLKFASMHVGRDMAII
jgi:hypothetical protein